MLLQAESLISELLPFPLLVEAPRKANGLRRPSRDSGTVVYHHYSGDTMSNQIVRMLPTFEAAEAARASLLAEGFDRDGINVNVTTDEAGPAESNFYVGDSPAVKGGSDYEDVFKPAARGDLCVMTVTAADAAQLERAAAILEHNGGIDADPAHRAANNSF